MYYFLVAHILCTPGVGVYNSFHAGMIGRHLLRCHERGILYNTVYMYRYAGIQDPYIDYYSYSLDLPITDVR